MLLHISRSQHRARHDRCQAIADGNRMLRACSRTIAVAKAAVRTCTVTGIHHTHRLTGRHAFIFHFYCHIVMVTGAPHKGHLFNNCRGTLSKNLCTTLPLHPRLPGEHRPISALPSGKRFGIAVTAGKSAGSAVGSPAGRHGQPPAFHPPERQTRMDATDKDQTCDQSDHNNDYNTSEHLSPPY